MHGRHCRFCWPAGCSPVMGCMSRHETDGGDVRQRREIADRVIARWKERGFALDADPHYMQIVELWIACEIGGAEMRERYAQLLRLQADKRAGRVLGPGP